MFLLTRLSKKWALKVKLPNCILHYFVRVLDLLKNWVEKVENFWSKVLYVGMIGLLSRSTFLRIFEN
jgi:hypothetical protein